MLQIKDIHKEYRTGNLVQRALDGVSLSLRDNEFGTRLVTTPDAIPNIIVRQLY